MIAEQGGVSERAAPVSVRVITSEAEFAALRSEWEALQGRTEVTSIFQTFDWQFLWWKSYGEQQELRILLAATEHQIVAILPLYLQTIRVLGCTVRQLRLLGTGGDTSPDDLGPLLSSGFEVEAARALASSLLSMFDWDLLLLSDLRAECPFTRALRETASSQNLFTLSGRSARIVYLDLPESWEKWLQTLHRDRRYRVRSLRKKLNAAHPSRFFVWTDPRTLDQGIDHLIRLHHKRWQSVGEREHAFASVEYVSFHRAVMAACAKQDRLRLYCLELSERVVAVGYYYKFRDCIYLMQSGFDPEFADLKPGQVLLGQIIEHAIGEGLKRLDFLRGDHRYKDELATGARETSYLLLFRRSRGAWAYRARRVLLPALKAAVLRSVGRLRAPRTALT